MVLQSITSYIKINKKILFFIAGILGFWLLSFSGAFAAPSNSTGITQEQGDKLINILNMILSGAGAILAIVTSFISIFLYPGWVNGTMFGLQDYLKEIWILVSNVVYFVFAGILIVIAFMNIIGKGDGTWELKQAMPKFIIGVLIVPFSWFAVQFLLSLSAILTVSVLTLPYNSFQNQPLYSQALDNSEIADQKFCKDIIISFSQDFGGQATTNLVEGQETQFDENIRCKGEEGGEGMVSIKDIISGEGNAEGLDNNIFGVINVYTYGILRVQDLDTVENVNLQFVKGIFDLIFKILFDLLFVIVYMLLMVALFLALLTRGIRLWIYMMLSPVFGLLYFLGKAGEEGSESKFTPKEFIALAFVPVYVAAALAFGLTFIMVASEGIKQNASTDDMDTLNAGGFSLSIIGAHGSGPEEVSVIGKLIVELFGVVILWIAVIAALNTSATTKAIIAPITAFGASVGKLAAAAPTYAPIIPTGNGGMSITGLQQVGSSVSSKFQTDAQNRGTEFAKNLPGMNDDGSMDLSQKSINALTRFENDSDKLTSESFNELKSAVETGGDIKKLSRHPEFLKTINTIVEKDPMFANIKSMGNISNGEEQRMAQLLSEMDLVISKTKPGLGDLLVDEEKGTSASVASVDARIKGTSSSAGDTVNNITISGVGGAATSTYTSPEQAGQAFASDSTYTSANDVKAKLNTEGIDDDDVVNAVVVAFEAGRKNTSDSSNTDSGTV
ncbi:hypothetical protein GW846_01935 [Candidatus Gracilibacteria bacterium]|nr:hypothetical protein [Candidatus Gracilibacteria bacterium]